MSTQKHFLWRSQKILICLVKKKLAYLIPRVMELYRCVNVLDIFSLGAVLVDMNNADLRLKCSGKSTIVYEMRK